MGSEASKIRHSKSTGSKKSTTNRSGQHIIPPIVKTADSINSTDNLLNVDYGIRAGNSSRSSLELNINRGRSGSICSSRSMSRQKHPISIRNRNLIQVSLLMTICRISKDRMIYLIAYQRSCRLLLVKKKAIIRSIFKKIIHVVKQFLHLWKLEASKSREDRPAMTWKSCFQNPHEIIGHKILQRVYEKRNGFAKFYDKLSSDEKDDIEEGIKVLLKKTVANINFIDEVQRLAEEFGGKHVKFRVLGFKPEFFGVYADATITECIFLDNAMHPAHQTLTAFSSFITMVYSSVRDGFYGEMRRMRRASNSFSTDSNSSHMRKTVSGELNVDLPQRSVSPGNESGGSDFSALIVIPADDNNLVKSPSNDP
uniref:GLOBIN domain-containing protein n=1 Tax=Loa loa TaxID=7209 RepID=A0A1I7VUC9_LOALO